MSVTSGAIARSTDNGVKMGEIYRASAMTLSTADQAKVDTLGITAQYDLRTPGEIASAPDVVLAGSTVTDLNVDGTATTTYSFPDSVAAAQQGILDGDELFVDGAAAQQAYGTLLTEIANADGPVSMNCSAGKDRTGWASAVILTLLGVPETTVMHDYLLSNTYWLGFGKHPDTPERGPSLRGTDSRGVGVCGATVPRGSL
jgi:protein-tyrosine phosphatase